LLIRSCTRLLSLRVSSAAPVRFVRMAAATTVPREPTIIDGNKTAATIREELKTRVDAMVGAGKMAPGLAVILVGSRVDSATYVRMKKKACAEVRRLVGECDRRRGLTMVLLQVGIRDIGRVLRRRSVKL
jgi:hypothetical protein